MEKLKHNILYGLLGASSGLTGLLSFAKCRGADCTSCLGCAGAGIGLALILVLNRMRRGERRNDGMD